MPCPPFRPISSFLMKLHTQDLTLFYCSRSEYWLAKLSPSLSQPVTNPTLALATCISSVFPLFSQCTPCSHMVWVMVCFLLLHKSLTGQFSLWRSGLVRLSFPCHSPSLKEGRAGTEAEAMEGAVYQLAPHSSLSLLSYTTQNHLARTGTARSDVGPPSLIIN